MQKGNIFEKFSELYTKNTNLIYLIGVIFVTFSWRIYRLTTIPRGANIFELTIVNKAHQLTSSHWLIGIKDLYHALYIYLIAFVGRLANFSLLSLRISQLIIGTILVVIFYYFVKNWFNRQAAVLAALLMATNFFCVLISRNLEPKIFIPIIILAILLSFTLSFRTNKIIYFVLTGFLSGLAFYIDQIFVFLPLAALLGLSYLALKKAKTLKYYMKGFIYTALTALLIGSYPIYSYIRNISLNVSVFNPGSVGQFYMNLGGNIQSLLLKTPTNPLYNIGTEPILDPFVGLTFISGLVYAIFYIKRKKFMVLVNWFLFSLFIISLKRTQDMTDFIIFMPVIFTFSAIMLDYVLTHWVRTFPFNRMARMLMTFIFSLFLFLSVFYNYEKYFWAWGRNQNVQSQYKYQIEYQKK
jgi:4-amino-4-deoxy-L-arabinose transferase-like glycosyltransferase